MNIEIIDFKNDFFGFFFFVIGYGVYENYILSNEIEN